MWHPWQALRDNPHIVVFWVRPHPDFPAATDGQSRIWIDPRLNQVERRCVLTHELIHIERGHFGCQPGLIEAAVRVETAHRLISIDAMLDALKWARSWSEAAEDLWVTPWVLADRMSGLDLDEAEAVMAIDLQWPQDGLDAWWAG